MVDLLLRRFGADPSIGKGLVTPFRIAVNQQDKHPELRDLLDVSDRSSYVTTLELPWYMERNRSWHFPIC